MSVYFIKSGPYTKVGYSNNPLVRVGTVTIAGKRPADLPRKADARLIGWIPGDVRREMAMLVHFAEHWVAGEWFVLNEAEVRDLIWADPGGVDMDRMTAMAVMAAVQYPDATRDEIAAAGVPIDAVSVENAIDALDKYLREAS